MPRIDPMTGVPVMTTEFWSAEAEHEGQGRSGGEVMTDFYEEMEREARLDEILMWEEAFGQLVALAQDEVRWWKEGEEWFNASRGQPWGVGMERAERPRMPVECLEVIDVKLNEGLRDQSGTIIARVVADDGLTYRLTATWSHYGGTMWEPPDDDQELTWEHEAESTS